MPTGFDMATAVMWADVDDVAYGVVIGSEDGCFCVVPVRRLDSGIKCYDEGGAIYQDDRHNVKLRDCPPPFSFACMRSDTGKCFAFAASDAAVIMSVNDVFTGDVSIIDDGDKVSDRDMRDIFDHLWRDEKERGLDWNESVLYRFARNELYSREFDPDAVYGRIAGYDMAVAAEAAGPAQDWRSFRQAEPEPEPVRKPMSAAERLRAAMSIAPQDAETDGPDGPDFCGGF